MSNSFLAIFRFVIPQTTGLGFQNDGIIYTKRHVCFLRGFIPFFLYSTFFPLFCLFRDFVCGCFLGVLTLFLFDLFFFVILFGGCCFVCTFAYKKGLGGPVTRRLETVQASAGYQDLSFIIPKMTGFGFSKRWVSFHKTTRIFFEGFSHPSFFRSKL